MTITPLRFCPLLLALGFMAGCEQEQIHSYVAPITKPLISATPPMMQQPSAPAVPTRMLGAILPQPDQTWFFKLTAPPDEAKQVREEFAKFVASTKFENGKPTWEIPSNWKEEAGREMRFTTFHIGENGPEVSISTLSSTEDADAFGLANVNRWRGQLGLDALELQGYKDQTIPDADGEMVTIKTPAGEAVLIDFVGEMAGGGGPPFARMGAAPPRQAAPSPAPTQNSSAPKGVPAENWKPGQLNSFRVAAYEVTEGDQTVEITLSSAGGDLLANINRWRGQVDLPAWSADELQAEKKTLKGSEFEADYVALKGPAKTILGAVIQTAGRTWFVKLTGPSELAEQEQKNFERYVESLSF